MRKLIVFLAILFITTNVYALDITISLTQEEVDVLKTELSEATYTNPITGEKTTGIEGFLNNYIHNYARRLIDKIVEKSGKGSRFTPMNKKIQIIKDLKKQNSPLLKTATEKKLESLQP